MSDEKQPPGAADDPGGHGTAGSTGERNGAWGAGWRNGAPETRRQLTRSGRQKVAGGVCGGLGRYFDLDPVLFRVPLVVLSVISGLGLVFYGFAWLLLPAEGEQENELKRLLSGRVEGTSLAAAFLALVGCGLFLAQLGSRATVYGLVLAAVVVGAAHWSLSRRRAETAAVPGASVDAATAQTVSEAPPETQAPPAPSAPAWWRVPLTKSGGRPGGAEPPADVPDGEGPVPGPEFRPGFRERRQERNRRHGQPIGGLVFLLAVIAVFAGTVIGWDGRPLGTSLVTGFACGLAVFALGLVVSAFFGRLGAGTVLGVIVTAALMTGASLLPKSSAVAWGTNTWKPASAEAVEKRYRIAFGEGGLDLSGIGLKEGGTVSTRMELGAGQLWVVVPDDARVKVDARLGAGSIRLPVGAGGDGTPVVENRGGIDRQMRETLVPLDGSEPKSTVELDLDMTAGKIRILRENGPLAGGFSDDLPSPSAPPGSSAPPGPPGREPADVHHEETNR